MNRAETIYLIKTLLGTYPNTRIEDPKQTVESFELELGQYPAETVYKAARCHMGRSKFFPTPAEIKKYLGIAPHMFNESTIKSIESGTDDSDDNIKTGCDVCPYANTDWVDSPNGCHRERCIV